VKPAGGWRDSTETAKLTVPDSGALGFSVAISGDTIVAGAPQSRYPDNPAAHGAAYVFVKPAAGWTSNVQAAKLMPSDFVNDADEYGAFGASVGISGDTIVVGAPLKLYKPDPLKRGDPDAGEAYVFVRPASGWASGTETARLFQHDVSNFGYGVAVSGDTVAAAPDAPLAIYLFEKPASGWADAVQTARLATSDASSGPGSGDPMTLAFAGDTILTSGTDHAGQGAVYEFTKPSTGWVSGNETLKITDPDPVIGRDAFGISAAFSGQTIAVGASQEGNPREGAVYVFGPGSAPKPTNCKVPLVKGKRLTTARKRITAAHCLVGSIRHVRSKTKKRGIVLKQSPRAGAVLPENGRVRLVVSRGRR